MDINSIKIHSLGLACTRAGFTDLSWYYSLPYDKRHKADRDASRFAIAGPGIPLDELPPRLLTHVINYVRTFARV